MRNRIFTVLLALHLFTGHFCFGMEPELLKQADGLSDARPEEAIALYKKAVASIDAEEESYDYLYANFRILELLLNDDTAVAEQTRYAQKCLEHLESAIQSGAIMHFTDVGRFEEHVIVVASNVMAWNMMLESDESETLEEALALTDLGIGYTNETDNPEIYDTKVRILLKLGRSDEAYLIVRKVLSVNASVQDFDDIRSSAAYKKFILEFQTTFTDEEKRFLEKAARIAENLRHKTAIAAQVHIPEKKIITEAEARKRGYDILRRSDENAVLVFKGDVHVNGDINGAWVTSQLKGMQWRNQLYSIVIDGNLDINGSLIDDNYLELAVTGNLNCDYVFSYNGYITISGNAFVTYGIYGKYNDGSLDIYGKLHTPYIIAGDHAMPRVSADEFIYIEGYEGMEFENLGIGMSQGSGWGWGWNYFEHPEKLLISDVLNSDGSFSEAKFYALVRAGKNPFVEIKTKTAQQ